MTFLSKLIIHFTYNSILSNWNYNFPIQKKSKKNHRFARWLYLQLKRGSFCDFLIAGNDTSYHRGAEPLMLHFI